MEFFCCMITRLPTSPLLRRLLRLNVATNYSPIHHIRQIWRPPFVPAAERTLEWHTFQVIVTSLCLWRSFFKGKMISSTRLIYKSCRNDGTSALKLVEIVSKNKLVTVVVLCFFIYEAGNFWNNPRICNVLI